MAISREYPAQPIVGVGGIVIDGDRVLLIRRSAAPLRGEWSIPGGMLELGETLAEGVRRELLEETGLEVIVVELIDVFERVTFDAAQKPRYHFVVLDYLCEIAKGEARAGSDAGEVAWAEESQLDKYRLTEAATRMIATGFAIYRRRQRGTA